MINWSKIQDFYNNDKTVRETILEFKISQRKFYKGVKDGFIKTRSKSESIKISQRKNPRKHTEETKKKLSEIRKKYLSENPDKVPYLLNHSSGESYPEKYFNKVFKNEGIEVERYIRLGLYELDFSIPDKKIDIEIDGNQHYYDEKIIESDKRRTEFLENDGWDIIRINWSEYQKMNFGEKNKFIIELKNYINSLTQTKPLIKFKFNKRGYDFCDCGDYKSIRSRNCRNCRKKSNNIRCYSKCKYCDGKCSFGKNRCEKCYRLQSRKVERPPYEQLKEEVEELGYSAVGRKYGVSDNSIRKWIKIRNW